MFLMVGSHFVLLVLSLLFVLTAAWAPLQHHYSPFLSKLPRVTSLSASGDGDNSAQVAADRNRRKLWAKAAAQVASVGLGVTALAALTKPAWAAKRSRTDGYKVQKSEKEWREQLSDIQYNILRQGGTERPYYSILEGEKRAGIFKCAGCGTELFASSDKFRSGTGWPSFARGLPGVEVEDVGPIMANLGGAELRCGTCGGHLGDVFQDGLLFPGTEAFKTGKRFCIDGVALVFYPDQGGNPVRGDIAAPTQEPDWLKTPAISARERDS